MISEKINRWFAEYKAEGRAEGIIILLKEHLLNNRLSKEEVRADIERLQKNGAISQDNLQRAIKDSGFNKRYPF